MSGAEKPEDRYRRFMKLAKITTGCPACGNTMWNITNDGGLMDIPAHDGGHFPVVMVSCSKCGNMRTHLRSTFEQVLSASENADE